MLAEIVRLDRAHHQVLRPDSELAEAIKVLARVHQNLILIVTLERLADAPFHQSLRRAYPTPHHTKINKNALDNLQPWDVLTCTVAATVTPSGESTRMSTSGVPGGAEVAR